MEPADVAVIESEAGVMDPEGVGWGLVFEEPPPGEPEEEAGEDPQPGSSEEAVTSRAPWMACLRVRSDDALREGWKKTIFTTLFSVPDTAGVLDLCFQACGKASPAENASALTSFISIQSMRASD
jgi:hypothetical protein